MINPALQRIATLEKKIGTEAKSPLFAQLAHLYLEQNRANDALRICDAGLAHFPFYTTGHLIKGKSLLALKMNAEARREFEFVLDFLPSNEAVKALLAKVEPGEEETIAPAKAQTIQPAPPSASMGIPLQPKPESQRIFAATPKPPAPPPEPTVAQQVIPEPAIPEQPAPSSSSFFDQITSAPQDMSFGFGAAQETETPAAPESQGFGGFDFSQQATGFGAAPEAPVSDFGFGAQQPATPEALFPAMGSANEEPFDQFANRRRQELSGENSISLDDYLNSQTAFSAPPAQEPQMLFPQPEPEPEPAPVLFAEPAPPVMFSQPSSVVIDLPKEEKEPDQIEDLANKLQGAKITPVINFSQKETSTVTEQDTPAGMGFVTPTLAEIYAKQGWFDDAIKAYKTLARNKPAEREKFEKRIVELEELKKKAAG